MIQYSTKATIYYRHLCKRFKQDNTKKNTRKKEKNKCYNYFEYWIWVTFIAFR